LFSPTPPPSLYCSHLFFFTAPATTDIYTLSLHDALPISTASPSPRRNPSRCRTAAHRKTPPESRRCWDDAPPFLSTPETTSPRRSEEHTSELQSGSDLVCRLLLEKKKKKKKKNK